MTADGLGGRTASGSGAWINAELAEEDADAAMAAEALRDDFFEQPAWEERYSGDRVWSGRVNVQLEAEAADLTPGRALDVGCGEGGDALWLAAHGWQVTALDFADAALDRAAEHAADAGRRRPGRDLAQSTCAASTPDGDDVGPRDLALRAPARRRAWSTSDAGWPRDRGRAGRHAARRRPPPRTTWTPASGGARST